MVLAFLTDVLGWEREERGLFGHTNAFYGTVEQQGRLTLHLHLLLWIMNSMSPQEIREKITGKSSKFRHRLIRYLESCQQAEFFEPDPDIIQAKKKMMAARRKKGEDDVDIDLGNGEHPRYRPTTQIFPSPPPPMCPGRNCPRTCESCIRLRKWSQRYFNEVDDLWLRSNIHTHHMGCLTTTGICRARFPRDVFQHSEVDLDGHLNMRHIEPMMNPVNPVLTYVSRCNTDVTSLLSGTAVKAVVSYVSDYISKLSLKSYQMFAAVYHVFDK
ncbi:hypothetical protein C8R43DRAFT_900662, partial [Mycena crocata]